MGPESRPSKKAVRGEVIDNRNTCKNRPELQSPEWVRTGVGALRAWNVSVWSGFSPDQKGSKDWTGRGPAALKVVVTSSHLLAGIAIHKG